MLHSFDHTKMAGGKKYNKYYKKNSAQAYAKGSSDYPVSCHDSRFLTKVNCFYSKFRSVELSISYSSSSIVGERQKFGSRYVNVPCFCENSSEKHLCLLGTGDWRRGLLYSSLKSTWSTIGSHQISDTSVSSVEEKQTFQVKRSSPRASSVECLLTSSPS